MSRYAVLGGVLAVSLTLTSCTPGSPGARNEERQGAFPAASPRGCSESVYGDLGPRWQDRAVHVGPVWFFARQSEARNGDAGDAAAPFGFLKILLALEPGSEVRIAVATEQAAVARLLYRADRSSADVRSLADGEKVVALVACRDRLTQFNGGVISVGVRRLKLWVEAGDTRRDVVLDLG